MNAILLAAEHELRSTRRLSDVTCQAFALADDASKHGFEACFAFLGCPEVSAASSKEVPLDCRVKAIRLMFLRVGAHADDPRWSSRMLDNLFDVAMRPSDAAIGDVVRALFAVLEECPPGVSATQAHLIKEVGTHIVGRRQRAWLAEDFSWLANALTDPNAKINAAQGYFAAHILPVSLISQCSASILRALHSTHYEDEVKALLED